MYEGNLESDVRFLIIQQLSDDVMSTLKFEDNDDSFTLLTETCEGGLLYNACIHVSALVNKTFDDVMMIAIKIKGELADAVRIELDKVELIIED